LLDRRYFKQALELFKVAGDREYVTYTLVDIGRSLIMSWEMPAKPLSIMTAR
jgi:hypothetical protein